MVWQVRLLSEMKSHHYRNRSCSMRVQVIYQYNSGLAKIAMKSFPITGNILDAAVCYQKAIEQDPNKLANRVVCMFYCLVFS